MARVAQLAGQRRGHPDESPQETALHRPPFVSTCGTPDIDDRVRAGRHPAWNPAEASRSVETLFPECLERVRESPAPRTWIPDAVLTGPRLAELWASRFARSPGTPTPPSPAVIAAAQQQAALEQKVLEKSKDTKAGTLPAGVLKFDSESWNAFPSDEAQCWKCVSEC